MKKIAMFTIISLVLLCEGMNCPHEYTQTQKEVFDKNFEQLLASSSKLQEMAKTIEESGEVENLIKVAADLVKEAKTVVDFKNCMLTITRKFGDGEIDLDVSSDLVSASSFVLRTVVDVYKNWDTKFSQLGSDKRPMAEVQEKLRVLQLIW